MKVALFDLDDTLFDHQAAVASGVAAHMLATGGAMGAADVPASLARWLELEDLHYHRYLSGELGFVEQRVARAVDFAEHFGVVLDDPEGWFDEYIEQYRLAWALHEDALACLDGMPGTRFGIITNGELSFQIPKLEAIGIRDRMEHVIASGSFGVAKPDPRIFEHAVSLFGVEPAEAAYIGDRLETDALGAARAGLTGVWVDRLGIATDADLATAAASGVHVVRGLAVVPALFG